MLPRMAATSRVSLPESWFVFCTSVGSADLRRGFSMTARLVTPRP